MRIKTFFVLAFVCCITALAQPVATVQRFGQSLQKWSQTNNISYRIEAENLCGGKMKCIVANNMAKQLAKNYDIPANKSYELVSFLACLQSEISQGNEISVTKVETVDIDQLDGEVLRGYELVRGLMTLGRTFMPEEDLFYVKDGRILKIDNLVMKPNGRIHVDFSDLEHEESIGFTYNYGKHFPYGGSIIYSFAYRCMLSVDVGVTDERDQALSYRKINEFSDVLNYKIEEGIYKPKFFVTVTPSFYFKYFSVGCGIGGLFFKGDETTRTQSATQNGNSGASSSATSTETSGYKCKLMIRPNVRGFIPCNGEWSIIVSGGYDYVFGYKNLNGWNAGLGLQYKFN